MPKITSNLLHILEVIGRFTYRSIYLAFKLLYKVISTTTNFLKANALKSIKPFASFRGRLPVPLAGMPPKLSSFQRLILIIVIFSFTLLYWFILKDLPKPTDLVNKKPTLSTKIYDRNHQLLFTFYKDQNRSLVTLDEIPDHFIKATLAIEDSQFYNHNGISIKGILRSINQIVFNQQLQGGSTITQQLIKNALLTQERTLTRKIKELILSVEVELLFSKDEILEMYLNEVAYGGTAYGVEQASQTYFGKSVKDLNLAESALLAGLPASPTTYSPFGLTPHLSIYRQHQVLNRMVKEKFIAPLEAELAKKEKIRLAPQFTNIKAPHFVMFVKDILVKEYGQNLVEQGGLTVTTSLDLELQKAVQQTVSEEIIKVAPYNITNGAAMVTNPKTGEILAMIGSRDYFDTDRDGQVNVTTRLRQPGSAIKPVNYSLALENGYTAASIIKDTPITYDIPGSKPYSPVNYDNRFHGSVTLRSALANSYNIPAVKLLAAQGVSQMIDHGKNLGITTWNQPERYGLSLTLGGAEVKMTDLAVVFGTFANQGQKINLHPILKVSDSEEKILMDFDCNQNQSTPLPIREPRSNRAIKSLSDLPEHQATQHISCRPDPVLSPSVAHIISDILSDTNARIPAFGSSSYLNIPGHQVAVKTGTTNDKRDNWTIGYTSDYLTAVWVGNNDNSPMSQVASGITGASPIWHKIMVKILEDSQPHAFTPSPELIKADICPITGQLACTGCGGKIEYFKQGTEPKIHCKPEYIQNLKQEQVKQKQERDKILSGASN